jgi:hypothetical protein
MLLSLLRGAGFLFGSLLDEKQPGGVCVYSILPRGLRRKGACVLDLPGLRHRAESRIKIDTPGALPMLKLSMNPPATEINDLVKNSILYKEFLAERDEILRHKWIESEKQGHDIGFEKALLDWIIKYRSGWRSERAKVLRDQSTTKQ